MIELAKKNNPTATLTKLDSRLIDEIKEKYDGLLKIASSTDGTVSLKVGDKNILKKESPSGDYLSWLKTKSTDFVFVTDPKCIPMYALIMPR